MAYVADEEEYMVRLETKLKEEVDEFLKDKTVEELADILEVVYAISKTLGVSGEELEKIRKKKADERGGFEKRIILEEA